MALQLDHLGLLDAPVDLLDGVPMQLPLDLIDEDPQQPRRDFDAESLQELAATIRDRGVRQPISVRRHPEQPGRWMLNFGARRLRASKLAGKCDIPAFVDEAVDGYDQVIENEQRDGLKPFELAMFVKKQLATGQSQADIAGQLGKSQSYVSFIGALIDPPDWLLVFYRDGKCRGVKELGDLRKLHEAQPAKVQQWLEARAFVSRADIDELRSNLRDSATIASAGVVEEAATTPSRPAHAAGTDLSASVPAQDDATSRNVRRKASEPIPQQAAVAAHSVHVEAALDGETVSVVLVELPAVEGEVFVIRKSEAARRSVAMSELRRVRLVLR